MPAKKITSKLKVAKQNSPSNERVWAVVAYLGALCIAPLLFYKDSDYVQFHAKQGCVLLAAWVLVLFLSWFPLMAVLISFPATIILLAVNILAIIRAARGERWAIPHFAHYIHVLGL